MAYNDYSENVLDCTMREPYFAPEMEMYDRIGRHLSDQDVKLLVFLLGNTLNEDLKRCIKNGMDLLLALESSGLNDELLLSRLIQLLKVIHRYDIIPQIQVKEEPIVTVDPLEEYVRKATKHSHEDQEVNTTDCDRKKRSCHELEDADSHSKDSKRSKTKDLISEREESESRTFGKFENDSSLGIAKKLTCDVRLRVKAEFCSHDNALRGSVNSNRQDHLERQFDVFNQANIILKARDLGYIVCDIKFSEITYLDAFWRDYLNGSLLEALKGVFITESLKQAVGNEAIKLLVHVDEDDYEKGRHILLQNLQL